MTELQAGAALSIALDEPGALAARPPRTRARSRSRAWRIVRVPLLTAYVLVVAELFLRFIAPVPLFPRHVCAAPYGIRVNEPNAHYWHVSRDICVEFRINSKGVRADREIPYDKPPGVKRIVVLGDSFGMGYEVSLQDAFTTRLEQELNAAGVRCEVVNLSVSGHGNAEELIQLREEGLRYQPNLVLLAWHPTDLEDNVRSQLFRIEGGRLVRCDASYLPGIEANAILGRTMVYPWIAEHSALHAWLREYAMSRVKSLLAYFRGKSTHAPAHPKEIEGTASVTPVWQALTIRLLQQIHSDSTQAGAKFMILDIPTRQSRLDFASLLPPDSQGRQSALEVFSPIPLFDQHRGALLYWEHSHYHFTPLACRLVGEGLARFMLDRGWLGNDPLSDAQPSWLPPGCGSRSRHQFADSSPESRGPGVRSPHIQNRTRDTVHRRFLRNERE